MQYLSNLFNVTLDELISDDDVESKRIIDDKRAKIAYAFAAAFLIATIAFAFGAYFSGYTLLCIGSFVCAAGYVIAAFLSKPRYKRFQSKNRLAYDIISKIIVIGIVVFCDSYDGCEAVTANQTASKYRKNRKVKQQRRPSKAAPLIPKSQAVTD